MFHEFFSRHLRTNIPCDPKVPFAIAMEEKRQSGLGEGKGACGLSQHEEDLLIKLPRSILLLIFKNAISEPYGRTDGTEATRTLASLACTCRTLRDILHPETERVYCNVHELDPHKQESHHCHLNSTDYPHSWYFDVKGYVRTDDMHAFTFGGTLWHMACEQLVGEDICKVQTVCGAFTDDLCRENAIFWRNLCRDARELRIMHWSKGANLVLKHNAKVEDEMMSRKMICDPEIVKAQKMLNISQTPRCVIPGPCKPALPCFSSTALPFDMRGEEGNQESEEAAAAAAEGSHRGRGPQEDITPEERAEAEKVLRSKWRHLASTFLLEKRLPRSGHCNVSIGDFIVIVGGFCPANLPVVDVILIHIESLTIKCPEVYGTPPAKRFRQTLNLVAPPSSSPLYPGNDSDHLLLMYGGWDALGCEYGGKEINTLTIAADGSRVKWQAFTTSGQAPSPRYNHCAEAVKDKESLFVYGGEGEQVESSDTCCYFLNLASLLWRRVPTFSNFKRGQSRQSHPQPRCSHVSTTRLNPKSGLEEVVIFGGFSPAKDRFDSRQKNHIFDMTPYFLCLESMQWTVSIQDEATMPKPRHRAAHVKATRNKLLLVGGISERGLFLDDVEQLNLTTLKWEEPPLVLGQPSHGLRHVAGCSAAGLFIFGGTTTTIFGVTPVTKLDVLQIGPPHELEQELLQNESKSGASTPKTPAPSPRPSPRKKRGNLSDIISDFVTKVKLGRGKYLEKFNMRQHQVMARHRASRHSFSG